jgi:heat shock protein HtpX
MPTETFRTQITRNRRNSAVLIALFFAFFLGMGGLIGYVWGSSSGSSWRTISRSYRSPVRVPLDEPPAPVYAEDDAAARRREWAYTLTVAAGAAGVAFVLTLLSYYGGSSVLLSMSKARRIQKADDPQLFNVVEELSLAAGLPMPKVYLIDDTAMNAFATGRDPAHASVAITTGLREKLTRDELQGVLAHELSHVRHRDILFATLVAVMVGTLVILCDVFLRSLGWGAYGRGRRSRDDGGGARVILMILGVVLAILAPILAKIIEMAISRQREFLADAGSVELTRNPQGLASALAKLTNDTEVLEVANRATAPLYIVHPIKRFEDRSASIFDTHPPVRERIARLMELGR